MSGRGRCFKAKSSGDSANYDSSIMNRVMLRFRPIAPKPSSCDAMSGDKLLMMEKGKVATNNCGKVERKYVRVRKKKQYYSSKGKKPLLIPAEEKMENKDGFDKALVTLQLFPEGSKSADQKGKPSGCGPCGNLDCLNPDGDLPRPLQVIKETTGGNALAAPTVSRKRIVVVETLTVVESVTERFMDGLGLFFDVEKIENLNDDTSPGFISDGSGRVLWVNDAYKKMVIHGGSGGGEGDWEEDVVVWLVVKVELPYLCPAFACTVRVDYTWRGSKCSRTVPCDVWRLMDFGGFAWKLDVKAALSLGPSTDIVEASL